MILKMRGLGWENRWGMPIRMRDAESLTNAQINEYLKASEGIEFRGESRVEVYGWIEKCWSARKYQQQGKKKKGRSGHT